MITERRSRRWVALLVAGVPWFGGCIASNVVAPEQRAIEPAVDQLEWQDGGRIEPGLYESAEIRGDAAASLLKIYYAFETGERYTAAALVAGEDGLTFQTLAGSWQLEEQGLVLDGRPPVPVRHARDYVRLDAPAGSVVLRKVELR